MGVFSSKSEIDFSDKNIERLYDTIANLKDTLREIGTSIGSQELNNLLSSSLKKAQNSFKKYANSKELFGGPGSLRDLECQNANLQSKLNQQFEKFCQALQDFGLKKP